MILDLKDHIVYGIRPVGNNTSQLTKKNSMLSINPAGIELNMTVNEADLRKAVEEANSKFMSDNRKMEYFYHKETRRYVIKVKDAITDELIRQIPSQKLLDYMEGLMEYIGLNIDRKV